MEAKSALSPAPYQPTDGTRGAAVRRKSYESDWWHDKGFNTGHADVFDGSNTSDYTPLQFSKK